MTNQCTVNMLLSLSGRRTPPLTRYATATFTVAWGAPELHQLIQAYVAANYPGYTLQGYAPKEDSTNDQA